MLMNYLDLINLLFNITGLWINRIQRSKQPLPQHSTSSTVVSNILTL